MSLGEDPREVRTFGDGHLVRRVSRDSIAGRDDDGERGDAQAKICFACHQESAALREHVPTVKGQCIDCHDAHSSDQKMLLRVVALSSRSK